MRLGTAIMGMAWIIGGVALADVHEYVSNVETAQQRYERLCAAGGEAPPSVNPLADGEKMLREHAVYPVLHSAQKRQTGRLADWEDVPFRGAISLQCDTERLPVPEGLAGYFKAAISDDTLYILAVVEDATIVFGVTSNVAYLNDCFELFLDPFFTRRVNVDDSNAQLFVTAKDASGKDFSVQGKIAATLTPVAVPGGWGVEVALPLDNDYFRASVFNGLCIGFNIMYNNNDTPGRAKRQHKLGWSGIDTDDASWQNPAVYGVLQVLCSEQRPVRPVQEGASIAANRLKRQAGETLADYSQLAKNRPSPAVVRGFGMLHPNDERAKVAREWGANNIRISVDAYSGNKFNGKKSKEEHFQRLQDKVRALRDNQLKAVVTCFDINKSDLLTNPESQEIFIGLWREVVTLLLPFKDSVWGYDLKNEP
ncbi:MAG: hypothetical protein GX617_15025, partial [Lentisphaerae bacterium]|nr:hypothetical protein [Lentisphaerota bacterium]